MNVFQSIVTLAAAFLAVFCEAALPGIHHLLGAQIDLLPALMVCAALNTSITTVVSLAVFGGLCFDALSANPMGVSILPLFAVGFPVCWQRELILRDLPFAQLVLGGAASAVAPGLTVLLLLTCGQQLLLGWGSLWQWLVMMVGGALATPILFELLGWCERVFGYRPQTETSFRTDREIQRHRKLK